MSSLVNLPEAAKKMSDAAGFMDDFHTYTDTAPWTVVATDSGGATLLDQVDGVIQLDASDGTVADEDEVYLHTEKEIFLFAADKPIIVEAMVKFTEANTDDANIMFGLADAWAANHLQDAGAGPLASYSGAVFFKEDGQTVWTVENSLAGTQKTTQLTAANSLDGEAKTAGGSWQKLRIEVEAHSITDHRITFKINDRVVARHIGQDMTSATEMALGFGVKNGSANEETLDIDYVFAYQKRVAS